VTILDYLQQIDVFDQVAQSLATTDRQIQDVLVKSNYTIADLPSLLSPALTPYLEQLALRSQQITRQRFGNTMQLFVPLYLSNECFNTCTYCGFSREHQYKRVTLTDDQMVAEAKQLKKRGFEQLLLLTGESPKKVGVDYINRAVQLIAPYFSSIGIEVQPLNQPDYELLINSGSDRLTLYQETYNREAYQKYHLFGIKKNYDKRLIASEYGGKAEFHAINLGILLGLYDWRYDALSLAHHLSYMMKYHWKSQYGVSFPRIKDMIGQFKVEYPVTDAQLVQIICAFRLCFPTVSITLSTREPGNLRDALFKLGITTISAESNTAPGGYSGSLSAEPQFEISDQRSLSEIINVLKKNNIEPVFKDWERVLT